MLNKTAIYYNIELNFKYITVISTFSEHITIFRTLSIDIWQLKCQQRQTNKTKISNFFSANFSELANFSSSPFWEKPLWNQSGSTNRNSSAFLLHTSKTFFNVKLFSIFPKTFLELIWPTMVTTLMDIIEISPIAGYSNDCLI